LSKQALLDVIASEVIVCVKCHLWKTRRNAVPGEGKGDANVMLVGEAPGYWEDIEGRPFVGAAGKLLVTSLADIELARKDVFICNILKCRPPANREPSPIEVQTCTPYLDRQLLAIQPKFLVTLGNYPTAYLFSKAALPFDGITRMRGKLHEVSILGIRLTIFPTFHPAAALYNAKYRKQLTSDFKQLGEELEKSGITK